jgi:hypothetical protein
METNNRSLKEIENEVKKQQDILEAKKKALEDEMMEKNTKKVIDTKMYLKRKWRIRDYAIPDKIIFVPNGKPEWPELAAYINDWGRITILEGAVLTRFDKEVKFIINADKVMELVDALGIQLTCGNIDEQIENMADVVKRYQEKVERLTELKSICKGFSYREYSEEEHIRTKERRKNE